MNKIPELSVYDMEIKSTVEGFHQLIARMNEIIKLYNEMYEHMLVKYFDDDTGEFEIYERWELDTDGFVDYENIIKCSY